MATLAELLEQQAALAKQQAELQAALKLAEQQAQQAEQQAALAKLADVMGLLPIDDCAKLAETLADTETRRGLADCLRYAAGCFGAPASMPHNAPTTAQAQRKRGGSGSTLQSRVIAWFGEHAIGSCHTREVIDAIDPAHGAANNYIGGQPVLNALHALHAQGILACEQTGRGLYWSKA